MFYDDSFVARITQLVFTRTNPETDELETINLNINITVEGENWISVNGDAETIDELITVEQPKQEQ